VGLSRTLPSVASQDVERILGLVHARTGADFREYRRPMIERRILHRMSALGCAGTNEYVGVLEAEPQEVQRLSRRFTINVSRFFRNADVFDRLRSGVLPALLQEAGGQPLRCWSAGTASGQEAWSLAILLEELAAPRASVLGTDLDPVALHHAARGCYADAELAEAPPVWTRRHLQPGPRGVAVSAALRRRVRFLRHDLTGGTAPVPVRFHLVACRNVLIYFSPALQRRVLRLLVDALEPGGVLCLGEAEWPDEETLARLATLDRGAKLFARSLEKGSRT
jgi:chemotaxis methyl-accepting protein methylase